MPEAELRKRKKEQSKTLLLAGPSPKQPESEAHTISQTYTGFLFISSILAGLGFIYFNPAFVTSFLNSWIGFSEQWEPSKLGFDTPIFAHLPADTAKRDAVVVAFKHAWSAYERDAMGDDEYHPISHTGSNLSKTGGIGYTVIDSIDTMLLMGLHGEHTRARQWVANKMSLDRDDNFNTFETTIRVLGGLLSAYHLSSGDTLYLEKAVDLADRILPAFDSSSGLPQSMVNLGTGRGIPNADFPSLVSTAEVATLQLELRYLSYLTGNDVYWRKAENVMRIIKAARLPHGLASIFMNVEEGQYALSTIRLGSRGDSFYEYLLKQYLQTNGSEAVYRDMYDDAMDAIHNHLIQRSINTKMTYTAELVPERWHPSGEISWRLTPKQDHLACFLGGSLMLGATRTGALKNPVSVPPQEGELSETGKRDWTTGVELVKTCIDTHDTATGLSPEVVHFRIPSDGMGGSEMAPADWYIKGARRGELPPYDSRYMLRPETVESLFIAFRLTGDVRYRDYGWKIFQSIEKHCRVTTGGYATVINVDEVPAMLQDKMETFMMSETLKYLYLLFDGSGTLPLEKYVFNTEAHPLPIFDPTIRTGFS